MLCLGSQVVALIIFLQVLLWWGASNLLDYEKAQQDLKKTEKVHRPESTKPTGYLFCLLVLLV